MLVSIITPIFKSQEYIEACTRSLFEQTYKDIEYIFVDDAGGDRSIEILERVMQDYPHRREQVTIIRHDVNRGSALSREAGLQAAHGDYVIHVDSDDTVDHNFIDTLATAVIENNADVAICNIYTGETRHNKFVINDELCKDPYSLVASVLAGMLHASLCNKLFRHTIFIDNDIHFSKDINMYDDKSVVFRALYYCNKIVAIDKDLYFYNRNNRNSITHKTRKSSEVVSALALVKLVDSFFADKQLSTTAEKNIQSGITRLKNTIAGMLLNHVSIKNYREEIEKLGPFQREVFLNQTNIPLHYKVALLLYNFKFYPLISLQRKMVVTLSNWYYKKND